VFGPESSSSSSIGSSSLTEGRLAAEAGGASSAKGRGGAEHGRRPAAGPKGAASSSAADGDGGPATTGGRLEQEEGGHVVWGKVELSSSSCSNSSSRQEVPLAKVAIGVEQVQAWMQASGAVFKNLDDSDLSSGSKESSGLVAGASGPPAEEEPPAEERKSRWSDGSKYHDEGRCTPCAWVWKANGCVNGQRCEFCHTCEFGQLKVRKKERVAMMKKNGEGQRQPLPTKMSL